MFKMSLRSGACEDVYGCRSMHTSFGPAVSLAVRGPRPVLAHFESEYGPATPPVGPASVDAAVRFGGRARADEFAAGHKSARWRVSLR